jgi:putative ABC transport system permease protein
MEEGLPTISVMRLAIAFIPPAIVLAIFVRWSIGALTGLYATARMLIQLLLIGYVLMYLFDTEQPYLILAVLVVMMTVAAWIALRPLDARTPRRYSIALIAIAIGGVSTLVLVTQVVLVLDPWFRPSYVIPLAGMIFSTSMNAVSLAAERFSAESRAGVDARQASRAALETALIPQINTLFAVGLVALPGMMTGQILSGVEPLVAVRYQIMVMCMLFGAAGMSAACYLALARAFEPSVGAERG